MASTELNIFLRLRDELTKSLKNVQGKFNTFSKGLDRNSQKNSKSVQKMSRDWKELALRIGATVIVMRQMARAVDAFIGAASTVEQLNLRLQQTLQNTAEANELFADMKELVQTAPVEFEQVFKSVVTLSAVSKKGAEDVRKLIPVILDIATTGLRIDLVTSNMVRVMGGGIAAADAFRDAGVTAALGFRQGVQVNAEESVKFITDQWEQGTNKMVGAVDNLRDTWEGRLAEMKDAWFFFRAEVGKAAIEAEPVQDAIGFIARQLNEATAEAKQFFQAWSAGVTIWDKLLAPFEKLILGQSNLTNKMRRAAIAQNELTEFTRQYNEESKKLDEIPAKYEKIGEAIQDQIDALEKFQKNIGKIIIKSVNEWGNAVGKAFSDMIFEGESFADAMKNAFKQMAASFIAQVAAMIAKWLAFLALRAIGRFFGFFHGGGEVQSFHQGGQVPIRAHQGLAVDEVPIIAQTGEGILSRRGMANLGGPSALNRLNADESFGGGGEINVNIYNPRFNNKEDVKELTNLIGVEIDRQLRYTKGF